MGANIAISPELTKELFGFCLFLVLSFIVFSEICWLFKEKYLLLQLG
jgi:hypothetical protein